MRLFLVVVLLLGGCVQHQPKVEYSGSYLGRQDPDVPIYFYPRRKPPRPWQEIGVVRVACPTKAVRAIDHSTTVEGGCSLKKLKKLMKQKARDVGGDGVCMLETSSGANGGIVSGMATVFHFLTAAEMSHGEEEEEEDDDESNE